MWFVEALQKKDAEGKPSGIWHLCANSDESGRFTSGCDHDHKSPEEAENCPEARRKIGQVTGFPEPEPLPKAPGRDLPRRVYVDLWTAAEKAIHDAKQAVEAAGCDPRLTDAVMRLSEAQERVADFVDGIRG